MPRASPGITAFNAGELSPLLAGRSDLAKYPAGCETLDHFIPSVQGPARFRPGTRYVDECLDSDYRSWLSRFEFNYQQANILEFNNDKLGFFTNRGRLLSGVTPYTITTPYSDADLINPDGSWSLSQVQTGDVVYLAGGGQPPQKLSRLSASSWTIEQFDPDTGPFMDMNEDDALTVTISAISGSITITAASGIFTADHVGVLFRIERRDSQDLSPWIPNGRFNVGDYCISDGKTYLDVDQTGSFTKEVKPTHTRGKAWDGPVLGGSVQEWEYVDSGYGIARITGYTSPTVVTADVITDFRFPNQIVGTGTRRWQFGAWGSHNEYPTQVTLWRDRLVFAGVRDVWLSEAADYENFAPDSFGEVLTDSAVNVRIQSRDNNAIRWMESTNALLVGTAAAEFAITESTTSEPFGPANVKAVAKSHWGGAGVTPVKVGGAVFFVEKTLGRVREVLYDPESTPYTARDITLLAEHITAGGVVYLAHQKAPESILWAVRSDGVLLGFTYEVDQDVYAWHRHTFTGEVEAVQVIPSPNGDRDDVWLSVKRTINNNVVRYVERIEGFIGLTEASDQAFHVECGLTYSGVPVTSVTGLDHLEGETVKVVTDGAVHPDKTVTGGAISLDTEAETVHVGLGYVGRVKTMRLEGGSAEGTSQGKVKRVGKVVIRVNRSLGGKVGPSFSDMQDLQYRAPADSMDDPPPLYSGDKILTWTSGFETDGYICVEQDQPLPFDLVAIYPQVVTSDR